MAALCWRMGAHGPEILVITSLTSQRWIIPKGWLEADMTPPQAAEREAFEEAGVIGMVAARPRGSFHYLKGRKDGGGTPCRVDVFDLHVTGQKDDWPEKGRRRMAWLTPAEAATRVSEPGLRQMLRAFRKSHASPRRRAG